MAFCACGDGGDGTATDAGDPVDGAIAYDSAPPPDAAPPDAVSCPAFAFGAVGGPCDNDIDCGADHFCVDEEEGWPATGYCTRNCATGADCAAGSSCRTLEQFTPAGGGPSALCLPDCCAQDVCPEDQVCSDRLQGVFSLSGNACSPNVSNAADGIACAGAYECRPEQVCLNDLDTPGGYCATYGCVVGDNTTCSPDGDGVCVGSQIGGLGSCLDSCDVPSDCREAEGYKCRAVGFLQLCVHPAVGEGCADNSDCGVSPWECFTATPETFPGGYCTVPGCDPTDVGSCTGNSFCHDPDTTPNNGDEYCVRRCGSDPDCRGGTAYSCVSRGNGEPTGCFPD